MTDPVLRVIAPGSPVVFGDGGIKGTVAAVTVRDTYVSYEVVWWEGATRHEQWVGSGEVEPGEGAREQRIGFGF